VLIGISSCLLGNRVRYDGGHRLAAHVKDTLDPYVTWVPVCPEVDCGLGVPRPTMQLTGRPENPRLVTIEAGLDHTERLLKWSEKKAAELEAAGIAGFVFKCRSPSCAFMDAEVFAASGTALKGPGLFARTVMHRLPNLPFGDEEGLADPAAMDVFLDSTGARPG